MTAQRIQKIIAQAGIASRRAAEKLISDGRVRVNGKVVSALGAKADPKIDAIVVEGHGQLQAEPLVYIAMHKPIGVISTVNDPEGRTTVLDVLERSRAIGPRRFEDGTMPRVYPVGRLDYDAEGLLLLTNDGELTNNLLHPRRHVPKTYLVRVRGIPDIKTLARLRAGVRLREADGSLSRVTAPAEARLVKRGRTNAWIELTIVEGRNHQVKRMCEAVDHTVARLVRTSFGSIELGELDAGQWRFLDSDEITSLKLRASLNAH